MKERKRVVFSQYIYLKIFNMHFSQAYVVLNVYIYHTWLEYIEIHSFLTGLPYIKMTVFLSLYEMESLGCGRLNGWHMIREFFIHNFWLGAPLMSIIDHQFWQELQNTLEDVGLKDAFSNCHSVLEKTSITLLVVSILQEIKLREC